MKYRYLKAVAKVRDSNISIWPPSDEFLPKDGPNHCVDTEFSVKVHPIRGLFNR